MLHWVRFDGYNYAEGGVTASNGKTAANAKTLVADATFDITLITAIETAHGFELWKNAKYWLLGQMYMACNGNMDNCDMMKEKKMDPKMDADEMLATFIGF